MDKNGKRIGAPTEYREAFISKVDEYLEINKDENYKLIKSEGDKSTSYENKIKVKLPTLDGFAHFIGHDVGTLQDWEKLYNNFHLALDKIRKEQKERLINSGLSGDYSPVIAKLLLSSNHGVCEKSIKELDATPDFVDIIREIANK